MNESISERNNQSITERIAQGILAALGWELVLNIPAQKQFIIISAPHTSLWDYPLTLLSIIASGVKCSWLGHTAMFLGPLKFLTQRIGGIRLSRNRNNGFVDELIEQYKHKQDFKLMLTPEGTTAYVPRWRTGFYHVARGANVPIALGFVNYKNKTLGVGDYFLPGSDRDKDMQIIKVFYNSIQGKNPDRAGPIRI